MPRRFLFRLFAAIPAGDHVPDGELLHRFVSRKDSAAFELLVRRHADAVWTAAVRILGNEADAEDVFQATFFALLRKATSVHGACIGGWLHRVAVNAALKLRSRRTPSASEGVIDELSGQDAANPVEVAELDAIVQQEVARLPERYRLPIILCELEGQSHADAARALGWPVGSVSGRLSRARAILRDRLARRGLAAPATLIVAASAPTSATSAAVAMVSGSLVASPAVLSLTEGVLSAMRTAKLKLAALVLAATSFVGLGAVGTVYALTQVPGPRTAGQPPPKVPPATPGKAKADPKKDEDFTAFPELKSIPLDPNDRDQAANWKKLCPRISSPDPVSSELGDDTYRKLLKARLQQGRIEMQISWHVIEQGACDASFFVNFLECQRDMRNVVAELWGGEPKTLVPWLEELVIEAKQTERLIQALVAAGRNRPLDIHTVKRHRLEAEAVLWKAKQRF
ncbi:MAG TPA: sigma-70 family RNA polymerase sigma factor [Gemmata sp.]|nr:sigma-70 family RNA polymerase sigma factor [Gemmata sp.]